MAKLRQDTAFGLAATTQYNNLEWVDVNKTRIKLVISCIPVSNSIITTGISPKPKKNITIRQIYTPTSTNDEDLVEEFYEQLDGTSKEIPTLLWNAKVGLNAYEQWVVTGGRFGAVETIVRGERLLEFARTHKDNPGKYSLSSQVHKNKVACRHTQPDWPYIYIHTMAIQIQHQQSQEQNLPGRGYQQPPWLRYDDNEGEKKLAKLRPRLEFNLEKLKQLQIADLFKATSGDKFAVVRTCWKKTDNLPENNNGALIDTASEITSHARRKKKSWMTNDMCDRRRNLNKTIKDGLVAMQKYSEINQ